MIMEIVAILVLLVCATVFFWSLCRQCVDVIEQLKTLRRIENVILYMWDDPKRILVFKKIDETNETQAQSMLELVESAEMHQRKKSKFAEKKQIIRVMQEEHTAVEKVVKQMRTSLGRPA